MFADNNVIYHYCSVETFMKILETKSIWLSHVQTTNDGLEDRMFVAACERILKKHKEEDSQYTTLLTKLLDTFIKKVDFPYIACFTHNKDLLSQWRAYGDDGKGVCIGFDLSSFSYMDLLHQLHGPSKPIVLIDAVSYHDKDDALIEKFLSVSDILREKYNYDSEEQILHKLVMGLEELSIFTKSEAFSEEEEIRMVYYPCYKELLANLSQTSMQTLHGLPIRFRNKGSQIVSYFEYPLPADSICEVVLGPKSGVEFKQLTLFLNQYAPAIRRNNKIIYSKISYR